MQQSLFESAITAPGKGKNNKLQEEDRAVHDWYRFVLSFPPHLVQTYLDNFGLGTGDCVLDPFCGTGTTLVECKKHGIASIGLERVPFARFVSSVKVDWSGDDEALLVHAKKIADAALQKLKSDGIDDDGPSLFSNGRKPVQNLRTLPPDKAKLLLNGSLSPLPMHKTLVLLDTMQDYYDPVFSKYEQLALAKTLAYKVSNLTFGPEVGVGRAKRDAPVVLAWLNTVSAVATDLKALTEMNGTDARVYLADSRDPSRHLEPRSIDAVITSPPYPNEKDYTRTTRLESVLLDFIQSKVDLRQVKQDLVRSNTRSVYKDDTDDDFVSGHVEIERIAETIEARRIALGKTSGFERLYARLTKLYFGGMAVHLANLRTALRPGAYLAYVVGDQASYLRVMIRTGQLLAEIAEHLGYEVVDIDLFRTRLATATREQLREEVVVLRWHPNTRIRGGTMADKQPIYASILERIFHSKYKRGMKEVLFEREEISQVGTELGISLPKNIGDLVYSFRYRAKLPESIRATADVGETWVIRPKGIAKYAFALVTDVPIAPTPNMVAVKIPEATPGIVARYALNDEQALLAKLRYNRLIDIFLGVTCYSLQNHLRTTVPGMGQVETDEVYVGLDRKGAHYVVPVQAKGGNDRIGIVQIEQDFAICAEKFPNLICRPVAAQFMEEGVIALFEFSQDEYGVGITAEKHYRLVNADQLTDKDIEAYRGLVPDSAD